MSSESSSSPQVNGYKMAAVQRALEYDVPVRTLAELIDVSKDIVARHKKHMYDPPPLRLRRSRSRRDLFRRIAEEMEIPPAAMEGILRS
jgi:hypothetical protein